MRMHLEMWLKDGGVETFGPYDATDEARSIRDARYWMRQYCRSGKVKAVFLWLGSTPILAYRSRPNGGYQVARGLNLTAACGVRTNLAT